MSIDADEYASWKEHPVTQFYMNAIKYAVDETRANFIAYAFDADGHDPYQLAFWRGQYSAYEGMLNSNYADIKVLHESQKE